MKKLAVIAVVFVLTSCSMNAGYEYPGLPSGITSLQTAFIYVSSMSYKSDKDAHGQIDYWQAPKETLERNSGDCEDFAILFSAFAYKLGYESKIADTGGHMESVIDGVLYDPSPILSTNGFRPAKFEPDNEQIVKTYELDEAIRIATDRDGSY